MTEADFTMGSPRKKLAQGFLSGKFTDEPKSMQRSLEEWITNEWEKKRI